MASALEIEVKFLLDAVNPMRRRLGAMVAGSGRTLEVNHCYDDPGGTVTARGMLLRLRRDRAARVTMKLPAEAGPKGFAVYREVEVEVADAAAMERVFTALGYARVVTYEKWREVFRVDGAAACLDELPFGDFLEIEGSPEAIRRLAERLGLEWPRRIPATYLAIFEAVKRAAGLPSRDLTFAAFSGLAPIPPAAIRGFEVGHETPAPGA